MTHMLLNLSLVAATAAAAEELDAFSYPNTAEAQKHWQPQFGSTPVRIEELDDGTTCLALDADFAKTGDRACWDWQQQVDLSKASRIGFDVSATNGGLGATSASTSARPGDGTPSSGGAECPMHGRRDCSAWTSLARKASRTAGTR